jgi:PAS domain S-box-containing protein
MKIPGIIFLFILLLPIYVFSSEFIEGNDKASKIHTADSLNKFAETTMDSDLELANYCAKEAFTLSKKNKYIKGQTDALYLSSIYYLKNEKYVTTLEYYFKVIDIYEQEHDTPNLVIGYSKISSLFFQLIKDYDLAKKYLQIMSKLSQRSTNPSTHGQVCLNWAQYYLSRGKCDSAIFNLYLCISYFHKSQEPILESCVYKYLGDAFMQKKLYDHAEFNYKMALSFLSINQNPDEVSILYTRIAHIHQVLENHSRNLEFNLAAMRIREKIGRPSFISSSYLNVGEAYWFLKKKDSASYYFQKSLRIAELHKITVLLEAIYSQLSEFAKADQKYDVALKYYRSYVDYNTKKNLDRNSSEFAILEAHRAIRENEIQNDLLNQEMLIQGLQIRNQRLQIFLFEVAIIIMLLLIIIVYTLARKNRRRKNELTELNSRLTLEIKERIEAEARLNRSEELHRFLADNTVDVISLIDTELNRLYISPSCEKFYGYTAQEILKMPDQLSLVAPDFQSELNQHFVEVFRAKKASSCIYKVLRKDGTTFWAESTINPVLDPVTNEVEKLITVVRDISERMKHEEELSENSRQKEYLLREIHNRVKNNFAILISLMNMQRSQSVAPELSTSLNDLQLRVRTMSLVHEQLYKSQEISTIPFDNYLHHLAHIISSSYNNKHVQLQTEIAPCSVAIEIALPLGLIVNELITNAYKYAFPGGNTGVIRVILNRESEHEFCIIICDNGIGLPADFAMDTAQSMGSQIVGILIEQIEATINVSSNGGACFRILFSTAQEK